MSTTWTPPKSFETRPVAILGGGVLGRRVACCWSAAGYDVTIRDPDQQQRKDALKYVESNVASYAEKTGRTPGTITAFEDLESTVKNAWLVIEAIPERLEIKIDTFAELEKLAPLDCLMASNSSSYKSSEMLSKVRDETRTRILNTHYYMPPQVMIVELMTDGYTHPDIFPWLYARHQEAALQPFIARKESTGFIFNRIWAAIKRECLTVMAEGVSDAGEIDELWSIMFGSPTGPCKMMDMVGLDTVAFIEDHYVKERGLSSEKTVDFLKSDYLDKGKLGNKSVEGGLFPPAVPTVESKHAPKLVVCEMGLSKPLSGKSVQELCVSGRLLEVSTDGKSARTLLEKAGLPDGIEICKSNGRLYWTDMGLMPMNNGCVKSCEIDGSDVRVVVPRGAIHTPKQIQIEEASRKIYVCDREGLRVMRCNLDGSELEVIVQTGDWRNDHDKAEKTKWCVGIAVAPAEGKFYWTQKGPSKGMQGRIFSANIQMPDGKTASTRTDIHCLLEGLAEPIDLEYHAETATLYWTDRGEVPFGNTLNKARVDGLTGEKIKHEIIAQNFDEAIGLKLDPTTNSLYVSDIGGTIWRCNFDGSGKSVVFQDKSSAFTGLTLVGH